MWEVCRRGVNFSKASFVLVITAKNTKCDTKDPRNELM